MRIFPTTFLEIAVYEKQGSSGRGEGSAVMGKGSAGRGGDPSTRDNCKDCVCNCDDLLSYNTTFLHVKGAVGGHHKSAD